MKIPVGLARHEELVRGLFWGQSESLVWLEILAFKNCQGVRIHGLLDSVVPRASLKFTFSLRFTRRYDLARHLLVL